MRNAPEGALAETAGQVVTESVPHAADEACWLCLNGESDNRWNLCDRCTAALLRQIRRRREAAARTAPLTDGRRDPLDRPRWSA